MRMTGKQLLPNDIWNAVDYAVTYADSVTLDTAGGGGKGAYVQLSASTARNVFAWVISLHEPSVAGTLFVDLAYGAAAAEVDIIDDLPTDDTQGIATYYVPRRLSSGRRLAARVGGAGGHSVLITVIGVGP